MALISLKKTLAKPSARNHVRDLSGIVAGCALGGFGLTFFLIPYKSSPGGVSGLSQIFFYMFDFPAGLAMLLFNIPLFIIGVSKLGRLFGVKTLWGILWLSIFTDIFSHPLFQNLAPFQGMLYQVNDHARSFTSQVILAVLIGSVFLGAGIGLVVRFNGSTGGSDIPALLLRRYMGLSLGTAFLMIDSVIIFFVGIVFHEADLILWGYLSLFVSSRTTDFVLEGISYSMTAFIFSDNPEEIRQCILHDMGRGCTIFYGEGGYTGKNRSIVFTALPRREIQKLKVIVKKADKRAFMVVNTAKEVFGERFKELE